MSPATSWTQASGGGTSWNEGITQPGVPVHILFGAIILAQGTFNDPGAASWSEASGSAASWTEKNQSSTTWVEAT